MYVAFPLIIAFAVLSFDHGVVAAPTPQPKLKWHYYNETCHNAEVYVRHQVKLLWDQDKSITAKLLRLVYTDCFVTVCPRLFFSFYTLVLFSLFFSPFFDFLS
jgi:peroxidase